MKRKRNPERADRENPIWTKETFSARVRRAKFCQRFLASKQLQNAQTRGRPKPVMPAHPFPSACPIPWLAGKQRPRLANPYGRNARKAV